MKLLEIREDSHRTNVLMEINENDKKNLAIMAALGKEGLRWYDDGRELLAELVKPGITIYFLEPLKLRIRGKIRELEE